MTPLRLDTMNRQQKVLLGLLLVLALAFAYRLANPFRQQTIDRLTYAPARTVATETAEDAARYPALVRFDLLRSPPPGTVTVTRDLFHFPTQAAPEPIDAPLATPPEPRSLTAAETIQAYFKSFKAFGSVRGDRRAYLFLEKGKQVMVVTRGDRIDGKYEILEVAGQSITLSAPELASPLTIELDEL